MTEEEIAARIEALATSEDARDAIVLCDAVHALGGGFSTVFGVPLPAGREGLRERALAGLRAWVPRLDAQTLEVLRWRVEDRGLPIDLTARAATLAAEAAAGREGAIAPEPIDPALFATILENPVDPEPYRVLADALIEAGSPRGELIMLQLAGPEIVASDDPDFAPYLERHRDVLLGPLAAYLPDHDERWHTELRWRWGYIHRAKLGISDPSDRPSKGRLVEVLDLLLRHPSGRFLAELAIGIHGVYGYRGDLADVIALLADRWPPRLEHLHLGDFYYPRDSDLSAYEIGDLSPLFAAKPHLRFLHLQGGSFELGEPGALDLPLVHARFITGGLTAANARAIAAAKWPRLRKLEVWFGSLDYGSDAALDDIAPLLDRRLERLDRLGLCNAAFADGLCAALPGTPLLETVKRLDLSKGCLTDVGARLLVEAKDALAHVEKIDVSDNCLDRDAARSLVGAFGKRVVIGRQKDPDNARYVSVGE